MEDLFIQSTSFQLSLILSHPFPAPLSYAVAFKVTIRQLALGYLVGGVRSRLFSIVLVNYYYD